MFASGRCVVVASTVFGSRGCASNAGRTDACQAGCGRSPLPLPCSSRIQRRMRWTHLTLPPLIHRPSLSDRVGDPSVHDLNIERIDETILRFHSVEKDVIRTSLADQHWRCNDEDICDNPEECECTRDGVKPEGSRLVRFRHRGSIQST